MRTRAEIEGCRFLPSKHRPELSRANDVVNKMCALLHLAHRAGTEIIYIPGNHDASLRHVCGVMLPAMQVRRRAIHVTADGRRLLVAHGDEYDGVTHFGGCVRRGRKSFTLATPKDHSNALNMGSSFAESPKKAHSEKSAFSPHLSK